MSRNRQSGNVGNLGDIIKHTALVELASLLLKTGAPVSFVDTHTFRLHAPLARPQRFYRELEAHVASYPAAKRYAELELAFLLRTNHYRCSAGLVLDVLGEHRECAVLGEANGLTRAELKEQIAEEGHARVHVVEDASAVDRSAWVPAGGSVLIHVDPFALTPTEWDPIAPALNAIAQRVSTSIFVLYRYSRVARIAWPAPPTNTVFVAENRGAPHEVAMYASPNLQSDVARICSALGFRVTEPAQIRSRI